MHRALHQMGAAARVGRVILNAPLRGVSRRLRRVKDNPPYRQTFAADA
jgi:hypothetical protein